MRALNVKLLTILVVCGLVLGLLVVGVHHVQVKRHAAFFLERAREVSKSEDPLERIEAARRYYPQYLGLEPEDVEAREEYGLLLADYGLADVQMTRMAYATLEQVLRDDPSRAAARRRLVDLLMLMERFPDARKHLVELRRENPNDAELLELLGQCQLGQDETKGAEATLRAAIEKDPHRLEPYALLASLLQRDPDRKPEAGVVLDKMVQANPSQAKAYLFRGGHLLAAGKLQEAQNDATKALQFAPDDLGTLLFASQCAQEQEQFDTARQHAKRVVDLAPKNPLGYLEASHVELKAGRATEACGWLDKGIAATDERSNGHVDLLWEKANILLDRQMPAEAEEAIKRLRKLGLREPFPALVGFLQARLDFRNGHWRKAIEGFEQSRPILQQRPQGMNLVRLGYVLSAECYARLGMPELQRKALSSARELGAAPTSSLDVTAKARALLERGQLDEAIQEYLTVLSAERAPAHAWIELTRALLIKTLSVEDKSKRDWREVDKALQKTLEALPGDPRVVTMQATVLVNQDRRAEAEKVLREAMEARVPAWKQWTALTDGLQRETDQGKAEALVDRAIADWGKQDEDLAQVKRLLQQGDRKKAEQTLAAACAQKADCWIYVGALAQLAAEANDWDKLAALLEETQRTLGDSATLRLLRARLLVSRDGKKAAESLKKLQEGIEAFPEAQRQALQRGLAEEAMRAGDYPQALGLIEVVAREQSNDLPVQQRSFEIAAGVHDEAAVKRAVDRIEAIDGKGPWWHYYEALRLVVAEETRQKNCEQALDLLAQARILRPNWFPPLVLAGNLYYEMGNKDAALKSYREAVDQGARDVMALTRFKQLLRQQGRTEEANQIIAMLERQNVAISHEDRFRRALDTLRDQKPEQAIPDIQKAAEDLRKIAAESDNFREHLQLAQYLATLADLDRARNRIAESEAGYAETEKALRRAAELAPGEMAPWASLVRLMQALDKPQEVQKVLAEARQKIPHQKAPLVLARCYEILDRYPEAEQQYQAASQLPDGQDLSPLRRLAGFYLVTSETQPALRAEYFDKAEATLRQILGGGKNVKPEDVLWARFSLAQLLLKRGGFTNRAAALALIDENLTSDPKSLNDRRLKGRALIYRGTHRDRQEARRILNELIAIPNPSPDDRFTLAELLVLEDDWTAATQQMQLLLASPQVRPEWLRFYIQSQIRHDELPGAESNLRWLDRVDPGQLPNATLRAWALSKRGEHDRAVEVLSGYVNDPKADSTERAGRLGQGIGALEILARRLAGPTRDAAAQKYLAQAEKWLREYVTLQPARQMFLVGFLGRRGQREEALKLAESAWKEGRPLEVAVTVVALLANGDPSPDQLARVEKILADAIEKHGQQTSLLLGMAELRTIQRRYEDAEKLYRQVLEKDPDNIFALNNLAVFLALRNTKLDESLRLINRAIEVAGPLATLCDTRATVYYTKGQWKESLEDVAVALAEEPSGTRYFHQAQAFYQANQKAAAAEAMRKADNLGLTADQLQPLERPAYRQLIKDLQ